jgi:dienelactone hydrolase
MVSILLCHHAQGLTPGVLALAETLRDAGHTVHTPDLYDGRIFAELEAGVAYAEQELGFGELVARGVAAAEPLPDDTVYAGISLGVLPAQTLLQTRPRALAGLFLHSVVPPDQLEGSWPAGVPVQVHVMADDPFGDQAVARTLVGEPGVEVCLYPGTGHLFTDVGSPDHDPASAALVTERALLFLDGLR